MSVVAEEVCVACPEHPTTICTYRQRFNSSMARELVIIGKHSNRGQWLDLATIQNPRDASVIQRLRSHDDLQLWRMAVHYQGSGPSHRGGRKSPWWRLPDYGLYIFEHPDHPFPKYVYNRLGVPLGYSDGTGSFRNVLQQLWTENGYSQRHRITPKNMDTDLENASTTLRAALRDDGFNFEELMGGPDGGPSV